MNRILTAIAAVLSLALIGAVVFASRASSNEAHRLVEAGAHLVDVRTPEEYAAGHLPGAVNIPVDQIAARREDVGPLDEPVVVYCHSGRRSGLAAAQLKAAGFQSVYDLGAMSSW